MRYYITNNFIHHTDEKTGYPRDLRFFRALRSTAKRFSSEYKTGADRSVSACLF